jgi:inosine-uridine nucleoside N-ribohydrolase
LDGVLHLPPMDHPSVRYWYDQSGVDGGGDGNGEAGGGGGTDGQAIQALADYLRALPTGEKLTVVITGPCTNLASLRILHPNLYDSKIDEVIIMGGSLGIPQWTPFAEFNIAVDPDALDELMKSREVRVVLVPLNVTHKAIFERRVHARLLDP